ncbi:hypothetical protein KKE45_00265 [Patescibacteria group bacterium]|nr:hypothetical protein [Patescibacteria group bacterium]
MNLFLSTLQYAKKHNISKMQVTRLINSGKLPAQKIGNQWIIYKNPSNPDQIKLEKSSSLQLWNKIIKNSLGKSLDIEKEKDREIIFAKMHNLGLPHQRNFSFQIGKFPTKKQFQTIQQKIGTPYWISTVPDTSKPHLNRQTKLNLKNTKSGWNFINKLNEKENYKIIISQYPNNPEFKGTALVSSKGNGIAEFITGDRHYIMTRAFSLTDPMLFDNQKILKFSKTISKQHQKQLFNKIKTLSGHFEFQYAQSKLTFFDYNDSSSYIQIDPTYQNLLKYFTKKTTKNSKTLSGLPCSPGKAIGKCIITHHSSFNIYNQVKKGNILVTDTLTPEMAPILNKVSAILTDLGAVTSHPAIVCRSLNIPTIIGIKNATQILRNNTKISINASNGTIKIL